MNDVDPERMVVVSAARVVLLRDAVATHSIGGSWRAVPLRAGSWRVRSAWKYDCKHLRRGARTDLTFLWAAFRGVFLELISKFRRKA